MNTIIDKNIKHIEVITVAKVASSTVYHTIKNSKKYTVKHSHSLPRLKHILENNKNTLIISGIRNPIDRNLSCIFANCHLKYDGSNDTWRNLAGVFTKKINNYKGDNSFFIPNGQKLEPYEFANEYFKKDIHNTFNYWLEEFFEITKIDKLKFNKKEGIDIYNFKNNNKIIIYTQEKLKYNLPKIKKYLDINNKTEIKNKMSNSNYIKIKKEISYKKEYVDKLLNTNIMTFFYTNEDIINFYNKIKIDE